MTLTLSAAHFVVLTDHVTNRDAASALALRNSAIHSKRIVEFIPTAVQSQTITASTPVPPSIKLDAFSGRSAGVLIVIKDGNGVIQEIPPDSEIDVVSASGRSEFGDGTKSQYSIVAADHFPELAGSMKTSGSNYRFLIVPFTDSVGKTLQTGSLSGSRVMRSDRSRIESRYAGRVVVDGGIFHPRVQFKLQSAHPVAVEVRSAEHVSRQRVSCGRRRSFLVVNPWGQLGFRSHSKRRRKGRGGKG